MDFWGRYLVVYRTVRRLAFSLGIALSITLAGFGSAVAANRAPVVVGFKGVPPAGFQNVLLNVVAVRLNPNASAAPTGSGWQKITVPAAIGGGGSAPPEVQIDLNNSQDTPQLFNTGRIKPNSYRIAQLILDPNNPGTLVPNCQQAGGLLEGCINYPFQLTNPGSPINVIAPSGTPALVSPGGKKSLASLILQLKMSLVSIPATSGGAYTVSLTMSNIPGPNLVFGTVTGSVPSGPGSQQKATRKLTVTAETIGTNTTIASAPITPNPSGTGGGTYTLVLPAAESFGTLYDLAVAGGKDSYGAARLLGLTPGTTIIQDFTKLSVNNTIGSISGKITDDCTGNPITNATIQLLIPPLSNPTLTDGSGDCTLPGNAAQCVSVATATTDNTGHFPQPGTLVIPSEFDSVPILGTGKTYAMTVSAPGYDTFVTPVNAAAGGGNDNCLSTGTSFVPCKIALSTGFITGNIPITAPQSGQITLVQVFAEDAGTNNIVGALPMPIIVRSSSAGNPPFKINVPTEPPGRTFDLFATTIDLYQGITDPFPGHTIAVTPNVTGPLPPDAPGACSTAIAPSSTDTINCVGHGSITGFAANADLGTSVGLAKDGVQITNIAVQNIGNDPASNAFAFCVPGGDTYTLQRFELPTPPLPVPPQPSSTPTQTPSPTPTPPLIAPTPAAVGTSIDEPVPAAPTTGGPTATPTSGSTSTPTGTPTPTLKCPTTCSNQGGTCPGICNTVSGVPLP
jgi:hypothetical protein